jgi:hypothetical protein
MSNLYFDDLILVIGTLAILNSLFGIFTIVLIFAMRLPSNFYRNVVITMTVFQTGYDLFLILFFCYEGNEICIDIRGLGVVVSGLGASFWSNVMIFMVLHVVLTKRIFPLHRYMYIISAVIGLVSILNGAFLMFSGHHGQVMSYQVYNFFSVTSIIFNIVAYGIIQYHLHRMQLDAIGGRQNVNAPIKVLANRLALYPLIQAVSRFGPLFYLLVSGNTLADYKDEDSPSMIHTIAAFSSAVTSPCAGIGYFIIFLCIQKGAYQEVLANFALACAPCITISRQTQDGASMQTLITPLNAPFSSDNATGLGGRGKSRAKEREREETGSVEGGERPSDIFTNTEDQLSQHNFRNISFESSPSTMDYLRMYELMDDDELLREIAKHGDMPPGANVVVDW